ncbi:hypothetical protein JMN32_27200 [Fulvivirga sp. 29W222]|uniref:Uncharacterized protein n=1 Tax=Fulvivirga marina TaxID=2494733 RepID=A0A937KEE5_9BACT|nr:hypothetical protein [Fulvivirga marina]MBL6450031.1 hypothetical protein [Fulvivirga marina]
MQEHQKHTVHIGNDTYNYVQFESVIDFHRFVDSKAEMMSPANAARWHEVISDTHYQLNQGTDWYGDPQPSSVDELNRHEQFAGMHLAEQLRPKMRDHLHPYLEHLDRKVLPKPKITYNDRGLGIFSFDRAAMSLQRMEKINLSSPLNKTSSQLNIELGRTKIVTTVKKAYAWFENRNSSLPALRLYLLAGGNASVEGNDMLYTGLACSELVAFLEQRNIPVEVNVLAGTSFQGQVTLGVVCVKRFQDKADLNQILLMSSDPRYFRFRGFKALIALADHWDLIIPDGLGRIEEGMGEGFVNALGGDGFVFGQRYSLTDAAREVKEIIELYRLTKLNGIFN